MTVRQENATVYPMLKETIVILVLNTIGKLLRKYCKLIPNYNVKKSCIRLFCQSKITFFNIFYYILIKLIYRNVILKQSFNSDYSYSKKIYFFNCFFSLNLVVRAVSLVPVIPMVPLDLPVTCTWDSVTASKKLF